MRTLLGLLLISSLSASDTLLDVDSLLDDIEKKTDLSEKTKLANSGISFIYTRNDLERMQARYLKDILKSGSIFGYTENRYGLPDPLTHGDSMPFMSSSIRVFIDNQEITGGMYGSGLILYGDLDIEFVDHIEIYSQTPTYEYSTEPTVMLIKLYSKTALKDEGTKLEITAGSFNSMRVDGYHSQELSNGWSYFTYLSKENLNREKYSSFDTEISRDKKVEHLFGSVKNDTNSFIVDFVKSQRDGFAGPSLDATPTDTTLDSYSLHLGYDTEINGFSFLASYSYLETENRLTDDVTPVVSEPFYGVYPYQTRDVDTISQIYSTELKYKRKISDHLFIIGVKERYKKYEFDKYVVNGIDMPLKKNTQQIIFTRFIEDQYFAMQNLIVTAGVQYVDIINIDAIYNDYNRLFLYRFGITYLLDNIVFKTIASHDESSIEPYLIDSSLVVSGKIKNITSNTIYENIIYQKENRKYEIVFGYQINKNYLIPEQKSGGKLNNQKDSLIASLVIMRTEYKYNKYDKIFSEFSYMDVKGLEYLKSYKNYKFIVRGLNTYKKFDIFNEIIYDRDNILQKNFYDYSAGVEYHYTKYLNISFKAENILNRSKEISYMRVDPSSFELQKPLDISEIDRKFTISMEYLF